ncbi:glutathione S-transferase N-terminal domain-containing protein [Pseudoroseomonas cervicalis]|uniref:glutathione S-transferase N-terminal domain-containing protein n=1 Tax=Teichococcus cervicalis TaxID=204525 RepID=UPI0022F1A72F|nr:glutathione S-transferase N-terminal domain-containing protein [Pseudoroseomonas cervicalis]WBV42438.1 glutathione S-transferase N-terminal domain-containing protein [Pseudoroseomonas cervicalis]
MRLHGYRHCPATARVRIALALKGVEMAAPVLRDPPCGPLRLATTPQGGLLPVLELPDGQGLRQSLAILEWLEEMWPSPPLLPPDPLTRARVRAFALALTADLEPLCSPRVLERLRATGASEGEAQLWARRALAEGLEAGEALLDHGGEGPFCFGAEPGLADICLVPLLQEARRFGVALGFPRLLAAEAASLTLPAFRMVQSEVIHAS